MSQMVHLHDEKAGGTEASAPAVASRLTVAVLLLVLVVVAVDAATRWCIFLPAVWRAEERLRESEGRAAQQQRDAERHQKRIEDGQKRQAAVGAALLLQQEDNLKLARELNLRLKAENPRGEP
jgi:hypothetical protein